MYTFNQLIGAEYFYSKNIDEKKQL